MHVLLVRHGQSQNNVLEAAHGAASKAFDDERATDPPLSELGRAQASHLGRHLGAQLHASRARVKLMCSSMTRALQTMQPLARRLGLRPAVMPELHEVKGFYDTQGRDVRGMGRQQIEAMFPGFNANLIPEEGQGAESPAAALQRARGVAALLGQLAKRGAAEQVVVIVSHNDFLCLLARVLLETTAATPAEPRDYAELFPTGYLCLNNTGVGHLILGAQLGGNWMVYWNRSDHLVEGERSGIQFKNVGFHQAAEWARIGEGGSGLSPRFDEGRTLRALRRPWADLATFVAAAAVGAAATALLLRRHQWR